MKKKEILKKIDDCMLRCDATGLENKVGELLDVMNEEDACKELTQRLFDRYNTFRAQSTAKLMEIIIRKRPQLAMINFPDNYLFRLAVIQGSMDLHECYIEEAVEPFLKGKTEDDATDCYSDLLLVAEKYEEAISPTYQRLVKGRDFNGAFGRSQENTNAVLIHQEDYEMMDNAVEKYNTIIGRREILKDLEKRMAMQ